MGLLHLRFRLFWGLYISGSGLSGFRVYRGSGLVGCRNLVLHGFVGLMMGLGTIGLKASNFRLQDHGGALFRALGFRALGFRALGIQPVLTGGFRDDRASKFNLLSVQLLEPYVYIGLTDENKM